MRFNFSLRYTFSLLLLISLFIVGGALAGFGQTSTATLSGTVQDVTGAVLPNVNISVTNTARNTEHFSKTNEVGSFVLTALNPGNYSITIALPGFKRFVRE